MQRQREKAITEPIRDYNNIDNKTPYYVNYNKPPTSNPILPQSTKSTDLRKSLLGFSNTFFNNVGSKHYGSTNSTGSNGAKETTPLLQQEKPRKRELSINPNDLSSEAGLYRKLPKEEVKNKDDYYNVSSTPQHAYVLNPIHQGRPPRNSLVKTPMGIYTKGPPRLNDISAKMPTTNDHVNISTLLCQQHIPLNTSVLKENFMNYESSKFSTKSTSCIKAYCANTHQGIVR
jgi:hypothetical protein